MSEQQQITFQRGPFGEIFPLPLLASMTGEECLERLKSDAIKDGNPLQRVPTRGDSLEGMQRIAMNHVQKRFEIAALDGQFDEIPAEAQLEAQGLRLLVVEDGEAMSVRPFMQEEHNYATFRPVFKRVEGGWQLGDPAHGRSQIITASTPGQALAEAFILAADWMAEEDEKLLEVAKGSRHSLTTSYLTYVLGSLKTGQEQPLPNGWVVMRTRHNIYAVAMGEQGFRGVDANPPVLARALVLLAQGAGQPLKVPPIQLMDLVARCEPRVPNFLPVETSSTPLTWRGAVAGEHPTLGDWIASYTARQMPSSGRWGVLSRELKGKQKRVDIAALVVASSGKERWVELRGLQDPLANKTIAEWESTEIQEIAQRSDLTAVAPFMWSLWQVFQALDTAQAKK